MDIKISKVEAEQRAAYIAECILREGMINGFGSGNLGRLNGATLCADVSFSDPPGATCARCENDCDTMHFDAPDEPPHFATFRGDDRLLIRVKIGTETITSVYASIDPDTASPIDVMLKGFGRYHKREHWRP